LGDATIGQMAVIVAFHAHPDDEALATGGTLARLAAEGHRVVIVVATDGVVKDVPPSALQARLDELRASAAVLGAARVEHLGYADSGHGAELYPDPPGRTRFVRADPQQAAARLAAIIQHEQASILLSYDVNGGYRHRDHMRVHEVGRLAADLTGARLLEATLPRELTVRVYTVLAAIRLVSGHNRWALQHGFTPASEITHRVDVRGYARQKRDALAAHASQLARGRAAPAFWLLVRLPAPLFGLALGREYFIEPAAPRTGKPIRQIIPPAGLS
jgi:LmbE family N-acetylglucosaminyl deacetylase